VIILYRCNLRGFGTGALKAVAVIQKLGPWLQQKIEREVYRLKSNLEVNRIQGWI
jgi:hypothetical protein